MICLEKKNVNAKVLPCGCKFHVHKKCYIEWNNVHDNECPLCRGNRNLTIRIPIEPAPPVVRPSKCKNIYMGLLILTCIVILIVLII